LKNAAHFFETARERENIRFRRAAGMPREDWTKDPNFQTWRFCNVHREHDKTTLWFRQHIREPLTFRGDLVKMVAGAIIFRWFNRIETGEIIKDLLDGTNPWDSTEAKRRLQDVSPVVTGAYIIKGPDGFSKLDGVLFCSDQALKHLPKMVPNMGATLREAWESLCTLYYMGPFMGYEVISDLRWTPVLCNATDINEWANAGPGCAHGLGRVLNGDHHTFNRGSRKDQAEMLELMKELIEMSREEEHWPQNWRPWEMREVEHWLCEYDKYVRSSQGHPLKRKYR
jgi:hypothetical protein